MNHQSLRADVSRVGSGAGSKYGEIIWSFINSTEALRQGEVDAVVEMEVEEDLEAAVRCAVAGCVDVLGVEMPSEERIGKALEVVRAYAPAMTGEVVERDKPGNVNKKRSPSAGVDVVVGGKNFTPRYYALQLEIDLEDMLEEKLSLLGSDSDADANEANVQAVLAWEKLKAAGRVSKCPHITIVHQSSMPKGAGLWNLCAALHALEEPPLFKMMLGTLVWNERVLAMTVERLEVVPEEDEDGEWRGKVPRLARELLEMVEEEVGTWLHVTVGTMQQNIPAVEARDLVEAFRRVGAPESGGSEGHVSLDGIVVHGRVRGLLY
jgi:tRNA ligase